MAATTFSGLASPPPSLDIFKTASTYGHQLSGPEAYRPPSVLTPLSPPGSHSEDPISASALKISLPSLEYPQRSSGQFWPGQSVSQASAGVPLHSTLPTPPTHSTETFQAPKREEPYNMAAVLPPQGAASHAPTLNAGSSLTSRRTATSNLPGPLELPVNSFSTKFNSSLSNGAISTIPQQQTPSSISNLLTPPSNIGGDSLSPISSGSTSASNPAANGGQPYTPNGYWPSGQGLTPYMSGGTGTTPQPQPSRQEWPGTGLHFPPSQGRFAPSLQSLMRTNPGSPNANEPSQPSYDLGALPPYPHSMSQPSTPAHVAAAQQQSNMAAAYSAISSPGPLSSISQTSPPASADGAYPARLPPAPNFYASSQPSQTPQSAHFPPYTTAPSPAQSALAHNPAGGHRLSPVSAPVTASIPPFPRASYPFGVPPGAAAAGGPLMHGMHSPGSPLGLMGAAPSPGLMGHPFNSGQAAAAQMHHHLYVGPHGPGGPHGPPPGDRPFKCDQCPQSFNRNHDLKRHKRIHLAVKPFPCGHCDKSFSRKDALKVSDALRTKSYEQGS